VAVIKPTSKWNKQLEETSSFLHCLQIRQSSDVESDRQSEARANAAGDRVDRDIEHRGYDDQDDSPIKANVRERGIDVKPQSVDAQYTEDRGFPQDDFP